MKKLLSLAMVAVMVLGFCAVATADDDLQNRAVELRALRTQIWTLISKPMPTAEDRTQLEALKQEYETKRWRGTTPVAAQEEPAAAAEADKAPAAQVCPATDMSCQPVTEKTCCACTCPCCKSGACTSAKACCKMDCCKAGVCTADKVCCDKCCCKAVESCKKCPKADGNKCKKFGKKHGKKHMKKHGCMGCKCPACGADCAPRTDK